MRHNENETSISDEITAVKISMLDWPGFLKVVLRIRKTIIVQMVMTK